MRYQTPSFRNILLWFINFQQWNPFLEGSDLSNFDQEQQPYDVEYWERRASDELV